MLIDICKCEVFEGTGHQLKEKINKWLEEHQPDILIKCITQSGYLDVTTVCIWYNVIL